MDDTDRTDQPVRPAELGAPDRTRSTAWVSLGALAVAVVAGRWISSTFLAWDGYDTVNDADSAAIGLLSWLVLALVVVPPAVLAVRNGLRSWRSGHADASVVVALAGVVGALVLLGLPVFLSHIVGWPLVMASILGVLAVGWLTQRWGWGHAGPSGPVGSG